VRRFFELLSKDPAALGAFAVLVILAVIALLSLALGSLDPNEQQLGQRLQPPIWAGGSGRHVLGTDSLGRDLAARLIHGTRLSLLIPIAAVAIAGSLGTVLGLIAGFYGGKADALIMRVVDAKMAFSNLLLIVVVTIMIGFGVQTLIIVFGLTGWVLFTRVVRGMGLALREAPFVQAARCTGCRDSRILLAHVLPTTIPVIVSLAVIDIGRFMIAEAGLSFLGFGVQPPDLSWGLVLEEGRQYLSVAVWIVALPGIAISVSVLAVTIFGAWLRSTTDPLRRHVPSGTVIKARALLESQLGETKSGIEETGVPA